MSLRHLFAARCMASRHNLVALSTSCQETEVKFNKVAHKYILLDVSLRAKFFSYFN